jgi:nucleoside-diphosphate kinase
LVFGILSHGQQISGCNGIYQVSHNEFVFGLEKHHMGWHWFVCLLAALKLIQVERSFAEKHYSDLSSKPFFGALVEYIISGPVVAMVWQGKGVVATGRKIIGATNPAQSEPGTIRGDFCIEVSRNVIHGSDAVESAQKEIALWFPEGITEWRSSVHPWIYEN